MSFDPAPQVPIRNLPPADAPAPAPMPRPKLSIAHLMLWTLGTAVVLSLTRTQLSFLEDPDGIPSEFANSDSLRTFLRISAIVTAPFNGIAVALLLVIVGRLYRGNALPLHQPGHWILLVNGMTIVLNAFTHLVHYAAFRYLAPDADSMVRTLGWQVPQGMSFLVAAALFILARRNTQQPSRWRFYFLANAAMMVIAAIVPVLFSLSQTAQGDITAMAWMTMVFGLVSIPIVLAWIIAFPLAVVRDLWLKERRDALHWAAIALVGVDTLASVANNVAASLLVG